MTAFSIKLIAILTLIIDHIGLFFFPDNMVFRIIGRISFPLFAWLSANGAYHTHNMPAYLKRVVICAIVSQIPFLLANRQVDPTFWLLNAVFTLSIGLGTILLVQKITDKRLWMFIIALAACIAEIAPTDYGAMGVLLILSCYFFFKRPKLLVASQLLIFSGDFLWKLLIHHALTYEFVGICALVVIFAYNNKPGLHTRYLFYIFYPLQYALIYLAQLML